MMQNIELVGKGGNTAVSRRFIVWGLCGCVFWGADVKPSKQTTAFSQTAV